MPDERVGRPRHFSEPPLRRRLEPVPAVHDRSKAAPPLARPPVLAEAFPRPSEEWLRRVCLGYLEALHGVRNPQQLRSVLSASVATELALRRNLQPKSQGIPTLTRLRVAQPVPAGIEISATYALGGRRHPLAIRLDQIGQSWVMTACELGR